jgi:predicted ABC-type ATPase
MLAIEYVKTRVMYGGHDIQIDIIRRRYNAGIENLSKLYMPICDYCITACKAKDQNGCIYVFFNKLYYQSV